MSGGKQALRITLIYLVFGVVWILVSDRLLEFFVFAREQMVTLSILKGWFFVVLTAGLIYALSDRSVNKLEQTNLQLQQSYDELSATHEELTAAEEELRQQFDEVMTSNEKISIQTSILQTLHETTVGLIDELDLDLLLGKIIAQATEIAGTADGFIYLLNKNSNVVEIKVGQGLFKDLAGRLKVEPTAGLVGQVLRTGQVAIVEDYQSWPQRIIHPELAAVLSSIHVPLTSQREVIGTIGLAFTEPGKHFTARHVESLERFAGIASIAMENARLHEEVRHKLDEREESEKATKEIIDAANDAITVHDARTGAILRVNRQTVNLYGYTEDELKQLGLLALASAEFVDDALARIHKAFAEGPQLYERHTVDKFGRRLNVEINMKKAIIHGRDCVLAVVRDISERKKLAADLDRSERQKLALLDAIPDLMLLLNREGTYLAYNKPADFELLAPPEQFIGKNIFDVFPADLSYRLMIGIQQAIDTGAIQILEYELIKSGAVHQLEARIVKCGENEALYIARDITDRKRMAEQVEFLSLHDALTGVYNRTYFEEEMQRIVSQKREGIGVIVCDVDGLKLINDTLGHRSGDEILKVVATMLLSCTLPTDVAARIGGDEFAVFVTNPNQQKMLNINAELKAFVSQYNKDNPQLPVSLSIGWAADFQGSSNVEELLKQADNNMYREKMHQSQSTRSSIVQAMMQALEARDHITEGHADRMQILAEGLARQQDLPDSSIADLRLLAKFHDIGKVGVPDHILFKPGRLTPNEMSVMRRHCEIGYRIAKSAPDLIPVADWILKHHEWWNGGGYPLGLKGLEIPLECRIIAIADAYDAMTSDRPYREAMSHELAIAEIARCAGIQFDPDLVKIFIATQITTEGK